MTHGAPPLGRAHAAGLCRLEAASGIFGAAVLGLQAARVLAPRVGAALDASQVLHKAASNVVYDNAVSVAPFASFVVALALALPAAAAWILLAIVLRRRSRTASRVLAWGALLGALLISLRGSPGLAALTALSGLIAIPYLAPHVAAGLERLTPTSEVVSAVFTVACESLAGGWGTWVCLASREPSICRPIGVGCGAALAAFGATRIVQAMWQRSPRALIYDAVAGAPLLLLAPIAIFRAPSAWILVGAVVLTITLRVDLARFRPRLRLPAGVAVVAGPWALGAIALIPIGLRDIATINAAGHEGQHYGWVNSALHGKLLWAEAGLIHSPLRDYSLAAYAIVAGATAEHLRMAAVLVNVVGLAVLLPLAWSLARRQLWLQGWYAYLLLAHTPARMIVDYRARISLGWADLSRNAWSTLALMFAISELTAPRQRMSRVLAAGAGTGLALLYSQEYGICAVAAVVGATALDRTLRGAEPWGLRVAAAARSISVFLAGVLAPLLALVAFYAACGRGALLLRTAYESVAYAAAGVWGSLPSPITLDSFLHPYSLIEAFVSGERDSRYHDGNLEFLLPAAAYLLAGIALLLRACRRCWSRRDSFLFGLLLFGAAGYRVALAAPEIFHLLSTTAPALILIVALSADAARLRIVTRRRIGVPVGLAAVVVVMLASIAMGERAGCAYQKFKAIYTGKERLSVPFPYVHDDIPRAGDIRIEKGVREIVHYVRDHSSPTDAIFVDVGMFEGPEIYWLGDRRNPTRFDMLQEILSTGRQKDLLDELTSDPPLYVIGDSADGIGDEAWNYLRAHWRTLPERPGGYVVRRRIGAP